MNIKAAIIGSTGYTGVELIRLLSQHPNVDLVGLTANSHVGKAYTEVFPHTQCYTDLVCEASDIGKLADTADVIFIALPHGHAAEMVNDTILQKTRVIDLGADFRLKSAEAYEQWYGLKHPNPSLLPQAIYGLTEWARTDIEQARLIANPGCYPTCSALLLLPLLANNLIQPESIIIDAKSGVTGAGRSAKTELLLSEVSESFKAYGVAGHRHTPEIEASLKAYAHVDIPLSFTPHLVPMARGILVTAYASLKAGVDALAIQKAYKATYDNERFVRLLPENVFPNTGWVRGSNYCDINFKLDLRTGRVVAIGAIDNLVKGAAGQAIQNMNRMLGLPEETGLMQMPVFP